MKMAAPPTVRRAGSVGILHVLHLLAAFAAVGTAACEGGDPGPMSGRQALSGRDLGDLFFWNERTLAFTRDTLDTSQPEPQDFLVWPLDEPQPSIALAGIDWTRPNRWPAW